MVRDASGEKRCIVCRSLLPISSHSSRLYCNSTCIKRAQYIREKPLPNRCGFCYAKTNTKYCRRECRSMAETIIRLSKKRRLMREVSRRHNDREEHRYAYWHDPKKYNDKDKRYYDIKKGESILIKIL